MRKSIQMTVMCLACLSAGVRAREYAPMLVDGRTWEYHFFEDYVRHFTRQERLQGTLEKFGKTYHVLMDPQTGDTVSLMREEGGRVYMLMNRSGRLLDLYRWDGDTAESTFAGSDETVVYDFTMEAGETLSRTNWLRESDGEWTAWRSTVMLMENPQTDLCGGGRMGQRMRVMSPSGNSDLETGRFYNVVEGIGILSEGDLSYFEPFDASPGLPARGVGNLIRVYESDGTVVYGKPFDVSQPLVRDDRVWEYAGRTPDGQILLSKVRFGDTSEVNGKTYRRLYVSEEKVWRSGDGSTVTSYPGRTVALLREEHGRVYVCVRKDSRGMYVGVSDTDSGEGAFDLTLYDFNALLHESFDSGTYERDAHGTGTVPETVHMGECVYTIADKGSAEVAGDEVESWNYRTFGSYSGKTFTVVEGIGPTEAMLWNPVSAENLGASDALTLNGVYDGSGNRIFGDFVVNAPDVSGVSSDVADSVAFEYSDGILEGIAGGELKVEVFSPDGTLLHSGSGSGRLSFPASVLGKGMYVATLATKDGHRRTLRITVP